MQRLRRQAGWILKPSAFVRRVVAGQTVVLAFASCAVSGLEFRQDKRVSFVAPRYRQKVSLPVTVEWRADSFDVTGPSPVARSDAGYFSVLVDVSPPPADETLVFYALDDRGCRRTQGCPDSAYLADRGIYTTTKTSLRIDDLGLAPGVDVDRGDRDLHNVTVILLDGRGRRIGESAWTQTFEVVRR